MASVVAAPAKAVVAVVGNHSSAIYRGDKMHEKGSNEQLLFDQTNQQRMKFEKRIQPKRYNLADVPCFLFANFSFVNIHYLFIGCSK